MRLASLAAALLTGLALAAPAQPARIRADVQALVAAGPRNPGTSANAAAREHIAAQLRTAGYEVTLQPFTYPNSRPGQATVQAGLLHASGLGLAGGPGGQVQAPVQVIEGPGNRDDFERAKAAGTIVIVKRAPASDIEDLYGLSAVRNAEAAGSRGIILVTTRAWVEAIGGRTYSPDAPPPTTPAPSGSKILALAVNEADGSRLAALATRERISAVLTVEKLPAVLTGTNVIARMKGVTAPRAIIGTHFDSVRQSPGAEDNASGSAALLEVARLTAGTPLARAAWFIAFDAEEDGLQGSQAFLRQAPKPLLDGLAGMITLDMVGTHLAGTIYLVPQADAAAAWGEAVPELEVLPVGASYGSDHLAFQKAGIPAAAITTRYNPNLHTSSDTSTDETIIAKAVQGTLGAANAITSR